MLLGLIGDLLKPVLGSLFPDPKDALKKQEAEIALQLALMNNEAAISKAAAEVVKTEAASSHWLAANWRPLTMLTFVVLVVVRIVAAMFGVQFVGVTEAEWLKLWGLIEFGLGGYVIGRSVEKLAAPIASALKK